ncbi:hypothetical protein [Hymenobacter sp. YC55]|uniref:hypothetical protein n=1 Tax=Hymenobacter sp. YC55 TaxID=3034019 RepID=UPI0023F76009|nr:hypothetical protein [Hymenobacter sp. YC55]MDF7810923.1 hypothetical protein [Hymenobacter sp. YC55]
MYLPQMPTSNSLRDSLFNAEYLRKRNQAVEKVLILVGVALFGDEEFTDNPEVVYSRIEEKYGALGYFTAEAKKFAKKVEECEKQYGRLHPYHPAFAAEFLKSMSSVKRWDAIIHFNQFCDQHSLHSANDYLYLIDVLEEGLQNQEYQKSSLERALSWLHEVTPLKFEAELKARSSGSQINSESIEGIISLTGEPAPSSLLKQQDIVSHEAVSKSTISKNHRGRQPDVAKLQNISLEKVRAIFIEINIGSIYNQAGEWAAAFTALVARKFLIGNAYAIDRWATECEFEGLGSKSIRKTLSNCIDATDSEDFKGHSKRIFIAVNQELDKHKDGKKEKK